MKRILSGGAKTRIFSWKKRCLGSLFANFGRRCRSELGATQANICRMCIQGPQCYCRGSFRTLFPPEATVAIASTTAYTSNDLENRVVLDTCKNAAIRFGPES